MKYRPEIDGLRAIAVLPVILFHAGFTIFEGGFVGVDIFFAISGYLITSIIVSDLDVNKFSLTSFYQRRARRILPALFFVLICTATCSWFWMLPGEMKSFCDSLIAVPLFISNFFFYFTSGYFDSASEFKPLLHTWSLAVEEQFYFFFPLLMIATWKFGKRFNLLLLATVSLLSLGIAQHLSIANPSFSFYLLPTRCWEIFAGAILSIYLYKKKNILWFDKAPYPTIFSIFGLALIACSIFSFNSNTRYPGLYTLLPVGGALLVIIFSGKKTPIGNFLSSKFLVFLGLISYSAYLWHQPIFALARIRNLNSLQPDTMVLLTVLSFVLAAGTWKFIEKPFRDGDKVKPRLFSFSVIFFAILIIIFGVTGRKNNGYEQRIKSAEVKQFYMMANDKNPSQSDCHSNSSHFLLPESTCILGNREKIVAALIGDSHADALAYSLGVDFGNVGLGMRQMTFNGCPPIFGVRNQDGVNCSQYNLEYFNYLKNSDIKYVIISSRWNLWLGLKGYDNGEGGIESVNSWVTATDVSDFNNLQQADREDILIKKYKDLIEAYIKAGKKVILVYPVPEVGWNVPNYLAKNFFFNNTYSDLSTSYDAYKKRSKLVINSFNSIHNTPNLVRIRPDIVFCNSYIENRCVASLNRKSLYYDDDHLSNEGAKILSSEIIKSIK